MSTTLVAQALTAARQEVGQRLLELPEDQWFDRKSIRVRRDAVANIEVAFANAEGGVVVIGLSNGRVEGIAAAASHVNDLTQAALDLTSPAVRHKIERIPCVNARGQDDELLAIWVEPAEQVHANTRDEVYLRVGDETRKLTFDQRRELLFDKGQAAFEAERVAGATTDDLDWELAKDYAARVGHPDVARLFRARSLADGDTLTTSGVLLFAQEPQRWFPQAFVRVVKHLGVVRETGSRQQIVFDERFEGPLPRQIEGARGAVRRLQPARRALSDAGTFAYVPVIPEAAWLEGLVNAVVHRAYSVAGDHIRIELFDDRIEVSSPGRFPGLVRLDDPLQAVRFARNPRIARVAFDLAYAQELGEGIRRMFDEMRNAGLTDPVYHQTSGNVRLVLSSARTDRDLEELPKETNAILFALREAQAMSTGQVAATLGVSRPTAIRRLEALLNAGLVEWVGSSDQDPRAIWRLPRR